MTYTIEVRIRGQWSPLQSSRGMNLSREEACDRITEVRALEGKYGRTNDPDIGLKFRIIPTLVVE